METLPKILKYIFSSRYRKYRWVKAKLRKRQERRGKLEFIRALKFIDILGKIGHQAIGGD